MKHYFIIEDLFVVRTNEDGTEMERWDAKSKKWVAYTDAATVIDNGRQVDERTALAFTKGTR